VVRYSANLLRKGCAQGVADGVITQDDEGGIDVEAAFDGVVVDPFAPVIA